MPCSLDLNIIVHVLSQPGFSAQNLPQLVDLYQFKLEKKITLSKI